MKALYLVALLAGRVTAQGMTSGGLPAPTSAAAPGISTGVVTDSSLTGNGQSSSPLSAATALATKASTGTDNSMTRAQALRTIDGPLTVVSSATILGNFAAGTSSMTVANGIVNAGSQPRATLTAPSGVQKPNVWLPIYWNTAATNKQNLYVPASSATLTVPVGGAGWWRADCRAQIPLEGVGLVINRIGISLDGAACSNTLEGPLLYYSVANTPTDTHNQWEGEVADGATFTCCLFQQNILNVTLDPQPYNSYFKASKLW